MKSFLRFIVSFMRAVVHIGAFLFTYFGLMYFLNLESMRALGWAIFIYFIWTLYDSARGYLVVKWQIMLQHRGINPDEIQF